MWELRNGIDGYLTLARAALGISVEAGERDLFDVEVAEGLLSIPGGRLGSSMSWPSVCESTNHRDRYMKPVVKRSSDSISPSSVFALSRRLTVIGMHSINAFSPFFTERPRFFQPGKVLM